ncbi:P-loop containing nucleoside triphosphate hydrolase protein [Suillus subluteus]|nr:P-loop containing nucleoside triphosphate hydrolase protein [Suillus subluteus]
MYVINSRAARLSANVFPTFPPPPSPSTIGKKKRMTTPARKLDPEDARRRVRHTRMGIWDLYEDRETNMSRIVWTYVQIVQGLPYVLRTLKDILSIRQAWMPLSAFLVIEVLASLAPAVSLWYSSQLFSLVETVMEARTADSTVLVHVAAGYLTCTVSWFPWGASSPYLKTIQILMNIAMTVLRLLSQFLVLITVLREQHDGLLIAALSFLQSISYWHEMRKTVTRSLVWVAATANEDYVRMEGLYRLVDYHRKELVAGNLDEYIAARSLSLTVSRPGVHEFAERVGDDAVDFSELKETCSVKDSLSMAFILREIIHALPLIILTLRVVQKKQMTIPLSLVSLILIYQISNSFGSSPLSETPSSTTSLAEKLANIRSIYAIDNKVVDGPEPFQEDRQSLRSGISIEFSTLAQRGHYHDQWLWKEYNIKTEGIILIDNHDIKNLRLADLRTAMSILFQDFTHFPLSIRENIGFGNPALAHDNDKIHEAARLCGAREFVDELLDGFNTYLERPVNNHYAKLFEDGRHVTDFSAVDSVGGLRPPPP